MRSFRQFVRAITSLIVLMDAVAFTKQMQQIAAHQRRRIEGV
ncbi:MAG TPA: hypothetical protein VMU62_10110 [Acidobacteriaceae bacterium]|nr:hypothetical protein [Acidobacteriaceae bacterium]